MIIVKKVIDYGTWALFSVFFILSLLFYITRDSLPGDWLFGTKLGLERVLIATSSLLNKQVDFQIDFVSRRYREISKVLSSKYGLESLMRLDGQVVETADSIANIKDPEERKEAANKYIAELTFISAGLEQEQEKFVSTPPPTYYPPANNAPPETQAISDQIDNTQETIEETITDMNEIQLQDAPIQPTATPTPTPDKRNNLQPLIPPTDTPAPSQEPTPTTAALVTPTPTESDKPKEH